MEPYPEGTTGCLPTLRNVLLVVLVTTVPVGLGVLIFFWLAAKYCWFC